MPCLWLCHPLVSVLHIIRNHPPDSVAPTSSFSSHNHHHPTLLFASFRSSLHFVHMPRTRTVLDSSPVEVPSKKQDKLPDPNPTEKLDSKPSLRALPTPPRTRPSHKRRRGRRTSRVTDSDSEDDHLDPPKGPSESTKDGLSVPTSDKDALVLGHKKRKMFQLDVIAEELSNRAAEDEFWTGSSSNPLPNPTSSHSNTRGRTLSRSPTRSPSSSPPTRKLRRSNTGLFSPPPSKRHPTTVLPRLLTPPPAPRTPPPKERKNSVRRKLFPERDSPNNPFLANEDDDDLEAAQKLTPEPHTPLRHVERPTVTYVLYVFSFHFLNDFH